MPLEHGKSKKAFGHNVEAEMHAGKPMKQSLAIAYAVKRRAKKMAVGGDPGRLHQGANEARVYSKQTSHEEGINTPKYAYPKSKESFGESHAGYHAKDKTPEQNEYAKAEHHKTLAEMRHMPNPKLQGLADGGEVASSDDSDDRYSTATSLPPQSLSEGWQNIKNELGMAHGGDLVDRIMKKRHAMYSEGGKVANEDEMLADLEPNEFDDLALRDDLKSQGTDNEMGNEYDADHNDMVSRIMLKRRRQQNQSPA